MLYGYKKFLVLAVIGALIIGFSTYLFLDSYFEKVEIVVFKENMSKGSILKEENLTKGYFYKNEIPGDIILDKSDVIGKELQIDRVKGDFLTTSMFEENNDKFLSEKLKDDEVAISINLSSKEKIFEDLKVGEKVMIVSTQKDKDMEELFYKNNNYFSLYANNDQYKTADYPSGDFENVTNDINYGSEAKIKSYDYLSNSVFSLSENISLIDGFLFFKNLEVLLIKSEQNKDTSLLNQDNPYPISLYVKCKKIEAPYLAKVTSDENYKLLLGKN
jgi:hypothetical protein